jgi:hypothetical protein
MATAVGKLDGIIGGMQGQNSPGGPQLATITSPDFGSGEGDARKLLN